MLQHRPASLARCFSVAHLLQLAQRRLPAPIFHYLEGGADDEVSLRNNSAAFTDYEFMPSRLLGSAEIDIGTSLLGRRIELPFILSPTGLSRLFHHEAESAVARAAAGFGTFYSLSTMGTTALERLSKLTEGPKIFQIYILKDRGLTQELVARCRAAKYDALCLTIDTPIAGNRERDRVTGMTLPPRFSLRNLAAFAARPQWAWNLLLHPGFELANIAHRGRAVSSSIISVMEYVDSQFDRSVTWRDVEWLRGQWDAPLVIKGIQSVGDARQAVDAGARALMISNHGGRQLDGVVAPVDLVRPIREAVGDSVELIVDGGIRRGTHILKALALGANACSVGRPYLYGLAAGGEDGVRRMFAILKDEIVRDLILLGCSSIADLNLLHIRQRAGTRL